MKKILAAAGIGAAIAIGSLVGAGTANADTSSFLYEVDHSGLGGDDSAELALGRQVCHWIQVDRYPHMDVVTYVARKNTWSYVDANDFAWAARLNICDPLSSTGWRN